MVKVKIDKNQDVIKQGFISVEYPFPHYCNEDDSVTIGRRNKYRCSICGRIID